MIEQATKDRITAIARKLAALEATELELGQQAYGLLEPHLAVASAEELQDLVDIAPAGFCRFRVRIALENRTGPGTSNPFLDELFPVEE